ncbi:saccharopine dehydrogenase NADP-binding domain-containing protein [Aquincola sp. S2]|uniref:Saccharopine dehydrogenase NADP-binding domain-containing protein n=1 Tax=Pseudaquabacterium terrae TaxID=2732868 RepID=A0ABX2EU01_9BURK|nr:saccharopine dehydrogenase NADP-binding domain-containing protein [Aquabacterium terrae]NRF72133.1 saccharopine dehydrogenase NADP-binding domain-containing protein [Aquabacterium terrae]
MRTLVLGGYGNFGARIARALAQDPQIALVVGGRDAHRAAAAAAALGAEALGIDALADDLAARLKREGVGLVVHTAGPFQQQDWRVAEAAAAAGAHYIDLADGRRFVCDFAGALDARFRAAGRSAITGASTLPALSTAAVDELTRGWQRIESIHSCIAPAQTAPRGVATLEAVLGYCGAPVRVWQDGRWIEQTGWADPVAVHFARLQPRLGALCDVPDLELLPARHPGVQAVGFRAALELSITQRGLAALAALRRAGLLRRPERLARLLHRAADWLDPFARGGTGAMVLRVQGSDAAGNPARRSWHVTAGNDHGPEIPCMAAILLARRLAHGEALPIGAMPCAGLLTLDDFAPEFARWGMLVDVLDEPPPAGG